jgi:hypothetical protein
MPRVPVYRLPSRLARLALPTVASALAVVLLLACGGGAPDEDGAEAGMQGGTPVAQDAAVDTHTSAVTLGHAVGDDGRVADGEAGTTFSAGDTVHVSLDPGDAAAGTAVEVVWYDPQGLEAASDQATVETVGAPLALSFDTTGWAPGTYRGEVWVGNELKEEPELTVEAGA